MSIRTAFPLLAGSAATAALAWCSYASARLAWADYLFRVDNEASVARAAQLVPANAEYHARLAALLEDSGSGEAAIESELQRAVAANPRLASGWIHLGLLAEADNDAARAERYLLHAVAADRTYAGLWTLANFCFRHNEAEKFWPAARSALRIGDVKAHDPAPLFRLCWRMSRDPAIVLERAIPDAGAIQARYLEFLLQQNLAAAAEPVTERVLAFGSGEDLRAVFGYCDRLIASGDAGRAIHSWNALCWKSLHGYRPLAPESGVSLTNGDFAAMPAQHGFDWRTPEVPGVSIERSGRPARLWISFDGRQPEACDVLEQYLPLEPSRRYRLRVRYQTDQIEAGSGLRWQMADLASGEEIARSADLGGEQNTEAAVRFTAPPEARLSRLALIYRRTPGTTRIEGRISLASASLEFDR
ncbi:MAG TPA: hypothetical protein VLX58_09045 [Bryobacteraceae bacterium]|nr:hypothetical protein [Bryobacteraceae bacterium]